MRNREFEDRLLRAVSRHAERSFGVDCSAYPGAVRERLELGAERYGADAFLERGSANLRELLEETPDVAGYALLSWQALAREGRLTGVVRAALVSTAVFGAAADHFARVAARALREGS